MTNCERSQTALWLMGWRPWWWLVVRTIAMLPPCCWRKVCPLLKLLFSLWDDSTFLSFDFVSFLFFTYVFFHSHFVGNCDVNKKDIYGRTAIFFAAYSGSSECVFFLLESGCDLADSAVPYIRNRGVAKELSWWSLSFLSFSFLFRYFTCRDATRTWAHYPVPSACHDGPLSFLILLFPSLSFIFSL